MKNVNVPKVPTIYRHKDGREDLVNGWTTFFAWFFGGFYFMYKGEWKHGALALLAGFVTYGLSNLVYCWFARGILHTNYTTNKFKIVRK